MSNGVILRKISIGTTTSRLSRLCGTSSFPIHSPGDSLDYTVDFTAWLADSGDAIIGATTTVTTANNVAIGWQETTPTAVRFLLAGGLPGTAVVSVTIETAGGRRHAVDILLPVAGYAPVTSTVTPGAAPNQITLPNGVPLLTNSGQPLTL